MKNRSTSNATQQELDELMIRASIAGQIEKEQLERYYEEQKKNEATTISAENEVDGKKSEVESKGTTAVETQKSNDSHHMLPVLPPVFKERQTSMGFNQRDDTTSTEYSSSSNDFMPFECYVTPIDDVDEEEWEF